MTEDRSDIIGFRDGSPIRRHLDSISGAAEQTDEKDYPKGQPLWLRWWAFKAWFHRCPECRHRPDRHYDSSGPRWEHDKVAQMLGIAQYGCRRCGHGSIEERDLHTPPG